MSEIYIDKTGRERMLKICDIGEGYTLPVISDVQEPTVQHALRLLTDGVQTLACGYGTGYVDDEQLRTDAQNIRNAKETLPERLDSDDSEAAAKVCDINDGEVLSQEKNRISHVLCGASSSS